MHTQLPLFLTSILFVLYRVVSCVVEGVPVNSAPIAALFLASYYFSGRMGLLVSATVWGASYPLLSWLQGYPLGGGFWTSVIGLCSLFCLAGWMKSSPFFQKGGRLSSLLIGSVLSALLFYGITNTFSWFSMPQYAKTWEGFMQAQWYGHPTFPLPTWVFLRNSIIGNSIFAIIVSLAELPLQRVSLSLERSLSH